MDLSGAGGGTKLRLHAAKAGGISSHKISKKKIFGPGPIGKSNCLNVGHTPLKKTETVTSKVTNFV